jgi:hypothetical protein
MDRTIPPRARGNDAACNVIDQIRAVVHEGAAAYIAGVLVAKDGTPSVFHGGQCGLEFAAMGAAELLKDDLKEVLRRGIYPDINHHATADRIMYDCTRRPLAWDVWAVLIQAEMARVREGAPAPLRVGYWWGRQPEHSLKTPWQRQCRDGLLKPMVTLLGAVEDPGVIGSARDAVGSVFSTAYRPIVEAYENGEPIPKVGVPKEARDAVKEALKQYCGDQVPVTITLREAGHVPWRNSKREEWLTFAAWLRCQGEKVIFVRDTHVANEPLPGEMTMPDASINLLVRAALYDQAKCNLFVSNGPAMLPVFMDCPWLMVNTITDERDDFKVNTTDGWEKSTGIPAMTGQWPWAKPNQRIIWQEDKFEHIRDAWIQYVDSYADGRTTEGGKLLPFDRGRSASNRPAAG